MSSKTFNHLRIGHALANVGDILLLIGLISYVYKLTYSPLFVIIFSLIIILSRIISNVLAPLLFEQYKLEKILIHAQIGKTVLIGLFILLFFYLLDPAVYLIYLFTIVMSFLDGLALPAKNMYVPFLIKREELMTPNGYLSITDQTTQIMGWAFGGLLYGLLTTEGYFLLLFFVCVISTMIKYEAPLIPMNSVVEKQVWFNQIGEGWREVKENKMLKIIFALYGLHTVSNVVWLATFLFLFVERQLQLGPQWWGYSNSSFFFGLMLGSLLLFRNQRFFSMHTVRWLMLTTIFSALITFILGWTSLAIVALLLAFLFGIVDQIKTIILQTILQNNAPPEKLGTVYAVHGLFTTVLLSFSALIAGWLLEKTGVTTLFFATALLSILFLVPLRFMNSKTAYTFPMR
jgi:MFS family permease